MSACVGGAGPRLVELGFTRSLAPDERLVLEDHLKSCGECLERYRRVQLAHRILAIGPERALDEPAPLELERIAEHLGLVAPARPTLFESLARTASSARLGLATLSSSARALALVVAFVAGTASAVVLLSLPAGDRELVARGGARAVSVALYAVSPSGEVTPIAPSGTRVVAGDHLKLRLSAPREAPTLGAVCVAVVPRGAPPRVSCLPPPVLVDGASTVPGSVVVTEPGPASIVVVASSTHEDPRALEALLVRHATNDELAKSLGGHALAIDRVDVVVQAKAPSGDVEDAGP